MDTEKNCLSWGVKAQIRMGLRGKITPNILREIPELSRDMPPRQECPYIWHLMIWKHPFPHFPNSCVKNPFVWEMEFKKWFLSFKHYVIKLSGKKKQKKKTWAPPRVIFINDHTWKEADLAIRAARRAQAFGIGCLILGQDTTRSFLLYVK